MSGCCLSSAHSPRALRQGNISKDAAVKALQSSSHHSNSTQHERGAKTDDIKKSCKEVQPLKIEVEKRPTPIPEPRRNFSDTGRQNYTKFINEIYKNDELKRFYAKRTAVQKYGIEILLSEERATLAQAYTYL
eukprot:COSAG01_NODE_5096_length_4491_cov_1.662796_4_plen_132_part_01